MPVTTPWAAMPSPQLTDQPNGPAAFVAQAAVLDKITIPRFATTTARDAAVTAYTAVPGNSMTAGMLCTVDGLGIMTWDTSFPGGAGWRLYPQDGPRGVLAFDRRFAGQAFSGTSEAAFQQVVATLQVNRQYELTYTGTWRSTLAGGQSFFRCRANPGTSYSSSAPIVCDAQKNCVLNTAGQDTELTWYTLLRCVTSPAAVNELVPGQYNLALAMACAASGYTTTIMASGSGTQNAYWTLKDAGPIA